MPDTSTEPMLCAHDFLSVLRWPPDHVWHFHSTLELHAFFAIASRLGICFFAYRGMSGVQWAVLPCKVTASKSAKVQAANNLGS